MRNFNRLIPVLLIVACRVTAAPCDVVAPGLTQFHSDTWGIDLNGQRYQSAEKTSIDASNVKDLKLKWAYGLATRAPRSYPLVTEDTVFVGDGGRGLVALDLETGCERWVNTRFDNISTAIVHDKVDGRTVLFFSDRSSGVHAVDAASGKTLWSAAVEQAPWAMYSGSPIARSGKVFVPLSSMEIGLSINPFYGCCTTSGGMAAFDAGSGRQLWHLPTISEKPEVRGRHWFFVEEWGPSGAPVWGAPMLDETRSLLFFGTGQNYSRPASNTSDAIFAVDLDTGEPRWIKQFTEGDAYNLACSFGEGYPNCPDPVGPDIDFGAPPILVTDRNGEDLLLAGQKSGDVYALRPDDGSLVWSRNLGRGGLLGGVHWGMAVDPTRQLLYVPISDLPTHPTDRKPSPGMYAVDYSDGSLRWSSPRESRCENCWPGLSAAIIAGPGIVVAGGLDGFLEIYAADSGEILWSFDSKVDYTTVNGIAARGGAFDAHGPMLAKNKLMVYSGYGNFGQMGGNAFLVFSVESD